MYEDLCLSSKVATGAWNLTLADCVYFLTIQAFHVETTHSLVLSG